MIVANMPRCGYVGFYSSKTKNSIISKLENLAKSDGEYAEEEEQLLNEIRELMK